jgi:hypothetical protein
MTTRFCLAKHMDGYYSGDSSDVDHTVGSLLAAQTPERAAVVHVAAAMREWNRQHGWLCSPEERAADRRETEQELAMVVAALGGGKQQQWQRQSRQ